MSKVQYVAHTVSEITPTTKFLELLLKNGTKLKIDIQGLMKAPIHSDNAWVNITPILKAYNVKLAHWLRNDSVKEYINLVNDEFFNCCNLQQLKSSVNDEFFNSVNLAQLKSSKLIPFPKSQWYTKEKYEWLNNDCPLICTRRGKYNSGTYLHKELFIEFITVLDVKLRREMHKMVMNIIKQADIVKIDRADTKTLFKGLTDTIRDIYIPAQTSENAKKFAYSTLATLCNIKVLGMTAKKYCKINNIEVTKEMISVRDALPKDKLDEIKKVEEHLNGFIKYAGITDYNVLKEKILGITI